jgi:WD40 repeat protein/serine/threonine protein kinase
VIGIGVTDREDLSGRMVGEFVVRERIDAGGFGAVYRCEQPLLGRQAVVKVLHRRLRRNDVVLQRFMREAQLASRLDHPYAAHVYAFGIEHGDGLFWIAMEMVQGTALDRWLRDRGPLSLEQFVPFFERVAEVVQTAHERGIVHRDLKPTNVMVIERAGRLLPKLLDFGIAKLLDEAEAEAALMKPPPGPHGSGSVTDDEPTEHADPSGEQPRGGATLTAATSLAPMSSRQQRLTRPDATLGSPPYMSPEQWSNAETVGPASDLYALGVVAYEALTGRRPFHAETTTEYIELHCHAAVPPLGDRFPPALDRLFQRALAKRPEDRWASALELAAALRVASGLGSDAADLPRLDEAVRDAWLADAPQPLAESIAALVGAHNAHEARDTALELVRNLLRYLLAIALATHAQVREDSADPALLELVRTMRRSDLRPDDRVRLLRLLVRPLTSRRRAHPIPELVDLVTPRTDDGADGLDPLLALHATSEHAGAGELVGAHLARLVPEVSELLRRTAFLLEYVLVVPRDNAAERWTSLRRPRRTLAAVHAGKLVKDHPMLLDREGRICVDLWPLMQAVPPTEGAEPELFLFDGRGRHGARLIAAPTGFEHHDPRIWEWVAARVIAEVETAPSVGMGEHAPYLGLTAFSTSDADRFVGREREIDAFLNRLRQRPLQIVVGPSGAGKSSFVHAGVVPGLPQGWRAVTLRPGAAPLAALASRLAAARLTTTDLRPLLERSPAAAAALVAHAAANGTIVIVIDQLEELFTLCTSSDERVRFAAAIAALAASEEGPIRVILAIRDDFLMHLEALAPLRSLLSPALVLLGNPSRDALIRIVVEPARRTGYVLSDPELARDMVNVVVDRPGALALLSFTASRLWELRDRRFRQLTRNAYDAMGGVGGALGRHAEATLDTMSPSERAIVREVFRHLVTAEGTRAVITAKELHQRLALPRADAVIDKLVAARLITVSESESESHVEVIHEALIDAWPRLQQWVREDVEGARMRDQIRISARQWHDRARPRGLLWRDDVLADLKRWLRRSRTVALSELETAFVEASRRYAQRAVRIRRGLVALGLGLAFAVFQYRAVLQTGVADARVTQSYIDQGRNALLEGKHTEALIYLAEAAHRGDDSPVATFMIDRAAQPLRAEIARLTTPAGRMWSAVFSPDGRWIVTTDDRSARVWDARSLQLLYTLPHADIVYHASFSPEGTRLVTASNDGFVKIWDLPTGALLRALTHERLDGQRARYFMAAMAPDGRSVAAIDVRGTLAHVWDASTGELIVEIPNVTGANPSLAFSPQGTWLAMSGGGDVRVFDTHTWVRVLTIAGSEVNSLSFDPTGPRLATATWTGDASIWELPAGARVHHLQEVGAKIDHIAFSPDGAYVVTASRDGAERVWSTKPGTLYAELKNHRGTVQWAEFDPTSKLVVSAGGDGTVTISDVVTALPVSVLEGSRGLVLSAHFDPSSRRVIGASWDGTARVWDATPPYRRWSSPPIGEDCSTDASLDGDQRFIAISCTRHGSHVWDTARDQHLAELPSVTAPRGEAPSAFPAVSDAGDRAAIAVGSTVEIYAFPGNHLVRRIVHPRDVNAVAFARTGHDLVSASIDGTLLITRDGGEPFALPGVPGVIDAAGFTPDGRVLAASSKGRLRVYDPGRKLLLAELALPEHHHARSFRVSADGHRLITIAPTGTPMPPVLWDLEHYRVTRALTGHRGQLFSARFVHGDREILTAGSDGIARLWDGTTGQLRQTYFGSSPFLLDAVVDPGGETVVTAGGDGVLRFWEASSGRLIWTLPAHRSGISGVHFEGTDLVTRSLTGEISRWRLAPAPSSQAFASTIEHYLRCLPLRFDQDTGGLVEQQTSCDISGAGDPR